MTAILETPPRRSSERRGDEIPASLPVTGVTPCTLQDFPGRAACVLWFTGCNMTCPYCHNPDMARGRGGRLPWPRISEFLRRRAAVLDGVVLSGGECTLAGGVPALARWIKELGYALKVDTNGARPRVIEGLLHADRVDYLALDFKAPLEDYRLMCGWRCDERWRASLALLIESGIEHEVRCTVHPDLLDEAAVERMLGDLAGWGYRGAFYLQHYIHGPNLGNLSAPTRRFDPARLHVPGGITLGLRNFTTFEAWQARKAG